MQAREFMSTPVECVRPRTPLHLVSMLLVRDGFTALPVVDEDNHVVGIISECDLLRAHLTAGSWWLDGRALTTAEAMTGTVVAITPATELADVAEHLLDGGYRSVPVVDGAQLLGIVSRRDLLCALASQHPPSGPRTEVLGPC